MLNTKGVSIVIPVYNGASTINDCLQAVLNLDWQGQLEVIVVDDGSKDNTVDVVGRYKQVTLIKVSNGGAAAATNIGIKHANYDIIISLDSDAILDRHWMNYIIPWFDDLLVGAVAGYADTANKTLVGKVMGYDVERRLLSMGRITNHLYTMNTAYRRTALEEIGFFSECMKIGYDVDISRRLVNAGYKLIMEPRARCKHYWRDDLKGYLKSQYGYAKFRIKIFSKFKVASDKLVEPSMLIQAPFSLVVLLVSIIGVAYSHLLGLVILLLYLINLPNVMFAVTRKKEVAVALVMPWVYTIRNLAWLWALIVWGVNGIV
ncbi:MAG: glycosyltransferase [Candidatus Methanomethyliaceae archaeon]